MVRCTLYYKAIYKKYVYDTTINTYLCGALYVVGEGVEGAVNEHEEAHLPQMDLDDEDEVGAEVGGDPLLPLLVMPTL